MCAGLHGPDRDTTDLGGILIRHTLSRNQDQRLTLIDRKLGESLKHVLNITLPILLGRCPKVSRIGAVRVLDMATVVTILAQERVAQDREQPRVHAGARLELLDVPPRAKDGVLYEAVRIIGVAGQRDRECA